MRVLHYTRMLAAYTDIHAILATQKTLLKQLARLHDSSGIRTYNTHVCKQFWVKVFYDSDLLLFSAYSTWKYCLIYE